MEIQYTARPDESIKKLAEAQHEQYEQEHSVFFGFTWYDIRIYLEWPECQPSPQRIV